MTREYVRRDVVAGAGVSAGRVSVHTIRPPTRERERETCGVSENQIFGERDSFQLFVFHVINILFRFIYRHFRAFFVL